MSDLFGNHIVGFPTRRLTKCTKIQKQAVLIELSHMLHNSFYFGTVQQLYSAVQ